MMWYVTSVLLALCLCFHSDQCAISTVLVLSYSIKPHLQVRDAFTNCQDSFAVHPKLIKRLKTYYEKNDPDR